MKTVLLLLLPLMAWGKLTVHLIAHTHDDVGWLKTADEYYYGTNNTIQQAGVQYIFDTLVPSLLRNPDRKFTYVETGFFGRWWREASEEDKKLFQGFIDNGQLIFINGGWSMHDEANPHYQAMVDQTTYGHQFLLNSLGVIPRVGWQIDPFGHTGTQAALLSAEAGFDSLFYARTDYQDRQQRTATRNMEYIWQGSQSLSSNAQVFAGGFYGGTYCAPGEFDWDAWGDQNAEPIADDPRLENYNVDHVVDRFIRTANDISLGFKTDNIMFFMGCDFHYSNSEMYFKNIDKLIKYVNANGTVKAMYSNPLMYTQAKYAANDTWQLKTDDIMPLNSDPHRFWSGYFTSRPALKRWARDNVAFYTVANQISTAAGVQSSVHDSLIEAIGLAEHHDAITGTERQHVAFDYAKQLSKGRATSMSAVSTFLNELTLSENGWEECRYLNQSQCVYTQQVGGSKNITTLVWNPLSQARTATVYLPVNTQAVSVHSGSGIAIPFEVIPASKSTTNYGPNPDASPYTLVVQIPLPPLGFETFTVVPGSQITKRAKVKEINSTQDINLENSFYNIVFDGVTGKMKSITNKVDRVAIDVAQDWFYYKGEQLGQDGVNSGAYVFRPASSSNNTPELISSTVQNTMVEGTLVTELRQTWADWVSQVVRLYQDEPTIEIEFTVGEIPIGFHVSKEVISKFTTNISSNAEWWTDSNGRDMQYRRRNWRQSYNFTQQEAVAGNYYPTVTNAFIRDEKAQLTIMTQTSQGSGSINDGELEFMVHRRLFADDGLGVSEPLDETESITSYHHPCPPVGCGVRLGPGLITRSKWWISVNAPATAAATWRPAIDRIFYEPRPFFSNAGMTSNSGFTLLTDALPVNVQVMTAHQINQTTLLVRLSHQFGVGEDSTLSQPVDVDLSTIFNPKVIKYVSAVEMTLTGNRRRADFHPLKWNIQGQLPKPAFKRVDLRGSLLTINPMEVRTFYVTVQEMRRS